MNAVFHPDTPIRTAAEDKLGRVGFAKAIARQIRLAPGKEGFVVGLLGPWGSGKSSLLNLVENELRQGPEREREVQVVRFNPWLVSGTSELVTRFFIQVGRELKQRDGERAKELGNLLEGYGELLLPLEMVPLVGAPWAAVGKALQAVGRLITRRTRTSESIETKRDKIRVSLEKSTRRLVFILDDIDRLHNDEIMEVMRLVRLVGDFPNCVYFMAFDRDRVSKALEPQGGDGHLYLEKILQVMHEVPPVRRSDLGRLLIEGIDKTVRSATVGPFDQEMWENVFPLGMFPLFVKVRDVRRYLNGLIVTLEAIGEEVALVDVLALDALRTLKPGVFSRIPDAVSALTTTASDFGHEMNVEHQKQIMELVEAAGEDRDAVEQLVTRLFPAAQQFLKNTKFGPDWELRWAKERRVAHERMLKFYLERSYADGVLPNARIQEYLASLGDAGTLRGLLDGLSPEALDHVLERLQEFEEEYPPESVEPALVGLFSQLPRLSDDMKGMFSFSPQTQLQRVIYRLLKRVDEESKREAIIKNTYGRLDTLQAKRTLVLMAGHKENAGHGFISQQLATDLEGRLTEEIAGASAQALATERDLVRLCVWVEQNGSPEQMQQLRETLGDRNVVLQLLKTGLTESRSQTMGDTAVKRDWRLPWEILERLVGADALGATVQDLAKANDKPGERTKQAIELAARYASGWRPKDYFSGSEE
jgi:predicted KAP-like P-loop ATPase